MIPFAETPQAKGLMRQIRASESLWRITGLWDVYWKAESFYNGVPPGQQHDDLQPTEKEISMSLEQALAANTAALEANTAALLGSKAGAKTADTPAADAPAKKGPGRPKAEAKKNEHTREELVAVLQEVKEKFDIEATRALFAPIKKMAEIPESDIDAVYAKAKEKLAEEAAADEGEDDDM